MISLFSLVGIFLFFGLAMFCDYLMNESRNQKDVNTYSMLSLICGIMVIICAGTFLTEVLITC